MLIAAFFSLLATILCFSLGLFVFSRNRWSSLNRIFAVLCFSFSYWSFTEFLARQSDSIDRAQLFFHFNAFWPFTIALFYHFVLVYTFKIKTVIYKFSIAAVYSLAVVFSILDLFIIEEQIVQEYWGWSYQVSSTPLSTLATSWGALIAITALIILLLAYKKMAAGTSKIQARFILLGSTIAVLAGVFSEWLCPLLSIKVPELTNTSFSIMAIFISYAIWRHELFRLRPQDAADAIIDTMSDALIVVNIDRKIEVVNKALVQMLGYTEQEVTGKGLETIIGHMQSSGDTLTRLLRKGIIADVQTSFRKKDGSFLPISLSWSLLRHKDKKLRGIVLIGRDITEREKNRLALQKARDELEIRVQDRTVELQKTNELLRREIAERTIAEKNLAAEKERLAITLRSIGDGVITIDTNESVVLLNNAAERITGWTQMEACGKKLAEIYTVKRPSPSVNGYNLTLQSRSGATFSISESRAPILDSAGNSIGVVLVFRDITEIQMLEEELLKTRKLESISLLASGIAHDFNNLLTGMITNLFMAKMDLDAHREAYQLITSAEKAAFRATSLTKQLLTFSKSGSPIKENASIKELIEDSVGFYLSGSRADYNLDLPDNLLTVQVDRGQIDQVLNNIILNADQAMTRGGCISVKAENLDVKQNQLLPLLPGKYVRVAITDEGMGIAPENVHRIFDPYFTTRKDGNGLGLTTAYNIIQKHGGYITVNTQLGKGTTFFIYLPATDSVQSEEKNSEQKKLQGCGKILIMDDEEIIRKSTMRLLSHIGYEVTQAKNGTEALELYKESVANDTPFDTIVLDLTVPGEKGAKEIIDDLILINPSARVIISSGYSNDPVMTEYQSYGFCAAISKPYNIEELSSLLQSVMNGENSPESNS